MRITLVLPLVASALATLGCSSGDGINPDGPYTLCDYSYVMANENGKGIGESCEKNEECYYGACVLPGSTDPSLATFGFCSRGCDCENKETVPPRLCGEFDEDCVGESKTDYTCVYVSSSISVHRRFLAINCNTDQDCTAIGWSTCKGLTTGGIAKVCHAL